MPPTKLEELKPGDMIVVSSTKGAKSDEITAITLLAKCRYVDFGWPPWPRRAGRVHQVREALPGLPSVDYHGSG